MERHVTGVLRIPVVVVVESAVQPEAGVEHERADDGAGAIAGGFEARRQRRHAVVEAERHVVAHAVMARRQPGEDRRVRGQRHRHGRERLRVLEARRGQAVERRRQAVRVAVRTETIAPERVDRDEQDVGAAELAGGERRRARRAPGTPGAAGDGDRQRGAREPRERGGDPARRPSGRGRSHSTGGDGGRWRLCSLVRTSRSIFNASAGATCSGPCRRYFSSSS